MDVTNIGRYEVIETLGRGAMGVVYLARDPIIDRKLAVKTLRVDLDKECADEFRERFMTEARAAGRLSHNGIVTIHDVGEEQEAGTVFIAMEYIEGHDLKEMLAEGRQFRPSEAARIAAEVATALDYAHSMGVVHRDIKPANIILTEDGTPKIMDFGVARLESSNLTVEGQFIGTPNFMSPEQISGKPVDGRSDIFSLGVLLFNLLTGQRPFSGGNIHEVTHKIVSEPCPIPSTVYPGLPPAFNPVILKCLDKDPEKRFQNGAQIAKVLAALARSLVDRENGDAGSTMVVSPELKTHVSKPKPASGPAETLASPIGESGDSQDEDELETNPRTFSPRTAAIRRPEIKEPSFSPREALKKLPLPPILLFEVQTKWVAGMILASFVLTALTGVILFFKIDGGPFLAPSDGSVRSIHAAGKFLRQAMTKLEAGDLSEAEEACRAGLDQAPASPGGRRILAEIRSRLAAEISSETTAARIDDLIYEGRALYRDGRYESASEFFDEVIRLDATNDVASSFLELIRERTRPDRSEPSEQGSVPSLKKSTPVPTRRAAATTTRAPRPTPGQSRITVFFESPITAGTVSVTMDGKALVDLPFDFTKKVLGIKRRGSGQIKKIVMIPSGKHTLGIELTAPEIGSMGSASFTEVFRTGSDWSLRVDLAKKATEAKFFLVSSSR